MEQKRDSSLKAQTRCVRAFPDAQGFALSSVEGRVAIEYLDMDPSAQVRALQHLGWEGGRCACVQAPSAEGAAVPRCTLVAAGCRRMRSCVQLWPVTYGPHKTVDMSGCSFRATHAGHAKLTPWLAVQAKRYAYKCHRRTEGGQERVYPVNALAFHPVYGTFASGGALPLFFQWHPTTSSAHMPQEQMILNGPHPTPHQLAQCGSSQNTACVWLKAASLVHAMHGPGSSMWHQASRSFEL